MPIGRECPICKHYWGAMICAAFPDGIPTKILRGEQNHSEPVEGDHGIQFEKLEIPEGE